MWRVWRVPHFCLAASLKGYHVPSVAKIVPEYRIGTAYGTMFSLQNLGLFAVPILAGYILDVTNPGVNPEAIETGSRLVYTPTMLMFVGFGILGFIFALLLKWDDKSSGYGLELPSNAQEAPKD